MPEEVRGHLPAIAVVSLLGIVAGAFAFVQIRTSAASMDVSLYDTLVIAVPCALMLLCSFAIVVTARQIGRGLYAVVTGACVLCGIASVIVTSAWASDPVFVSALLANSAEGATVVPPVNSVVLVVRDMAAFVVVPTVGCVLGAWVGSRLHAVRRADGKRR